MTLVLLTFACKVRFQTPEAIVKELSYKILKANHNPVPSFNHDFQL